MYGVQHPPYQHGFQNSKVTIERQPSRLLRHAPLIDTKIVLNIVRVRVGACVYNAKRYALRDKGTASILKWSHILHLMVKVIIDTIQLYTTCRSMPLVGCQISRSESHRPLERE